MNSCFNFGIENCLQLTVDGPQLLDWERCREKCHRNTVIMGIKEIYTNTIPNAISEDLKADK